MKRLYTYLKRFNEVDRMNIDIIFVMSNIIFGDTDKHHQSIIIRELRKGGWAID